MKNHLLDAPDWRESARDASRRAHHAAPPDVVGVTYSRDATTALQQAPGSFGFTAIPMRMSVIGRRLIRGPPCNTRRERRKQ
jgi:hypothetical protein